MIVYPSPFYGSEVSYQEVMSILNDNGHQGFATQCGIHVKTPIDDSKRNSLETILSSYGIPFNSDITEINTEEGILLNSDRIAKRNKWYREHNKDEKTPISF